MPGDDAGARRAAVVEIPRGERVELEERGAGIDKPVDPLAHRELAARGVAFHRLLATAARDLRAALAELGDELLHLRTPPRELVGAAIDLGGENSHAGSLTSTSPGATSGARTGRVPSGPRRTLVRMAVPGIVAHLDLDAFYAAVEELENPELRSQPLVVGGDPRGRGVVATANYNARTFGIHSAMSCAEALRRCPQAVFVRPRHSLYREYSRSVWETVRGIVPTVEQTGADEGYLDIGEVAPDFLAARGIAEAVRTAVRAATSLRCSLGVAPCKVVAKIASDARKPGGLVVVPAGKERSFLAPLAVRRLPGVGPKAEQRLLAAGIETIGQLAALADDDLRRVLAGSVGTMLRDRARGIDPRGLEHGTERISISVENTFERDISDRERLHDELRGMAAEVAGMLATPRPGRAHGDDEAPLRRLLHSQPLDLTRQRDRRCRNDRRPRMPPARPRPATTGREPCASSESASRASATSANSHSKPPRRA